MQLLNDSLKFTRHLMAGLAFLVKPQNFQKDLSLPFLLLEEHFHKIRICTIIDGVVHTRLEWRPSEAAQEMDKALKVKAARQMLFRAFAVFGDTPLLVLSLSKTFSSACH